MLSIETKTQNFDIVSEQKESRLIKKLNFGTISRALKNK